MNTGADSPSPQRKNLSAAREDFLAPYNGSFDSDSALRRVIDHVLGLVGVLDLWGTLVDINQTALRWGGLSRQEVIGKKLWETPWFNHDDETVARLRQAIAAAADGQTVRYDAVIRTAGDQRSAIDLSITPVTDSEGHVQMLVPSGVDVTDREVAIERYKNSEERLRLAAESTGFGTYDLDPIAERWFWSPETKRI